MAAKTEEQFRALLGGKGLSPADVDTGVQFLMQKQEGLSSPSPTLRDAPSPRAPAADTPIAPPNPSPSAPASPLEFDSTSTLATAPAGGRAPLVSGEEAAVARDAFDSSFESASQTSSLETAAGRRPGWVTVGALTGGTIAAATTGGLAMPAIGAALGAFLGTNVSQLDAEAERLVEEQGFSVPEAVVRVATHGTPGRSTSSEFKEAASNAMLEMAVPAGLAGARMMVRRSMMLATQVQHSGARELAEIADRLGVERIGIQELSKSRIFRQSQKVLGRFPFIEAPFSGAAKERVASLATASKNMLFRENTGTAWIDVAPIVNFGLMSRGVFNTGKAAFTVFKNKGNALYDRAMTMAEDSGSTVPSANIKKAAQETIDFLTEGRPTTSRVSTQSVDTGLLDDAGAAISRTEEVVEKGILEGRSNAPVMSFAKRLLTLDEDMTVRQFKNLVTDLGDDITRMGQKGFPVKNFMQIKKGFENALAELDGPEEVLKALNEADTFWRSGMETFQSTTGKLFGRVDKNVFRIGFEEAGTQNADVFASTVFKSNSADALRELRSILSRKGTEGKRVWSTAVRNRINQVFANATKADESFPDVELINFDKVASDLGLDDALSAEFRATREMLSGTGVRMQDLQDFVRVGRVALAAGIPNVSQFVARRAVLNPRSAIRSFLPTSALGSSALGAVGASGAGVMGGITGASAGIGIVLGLRKAGSIITDPKVLREAIRVMDPSSTAAQQALAAQRMMKWTPATFAFDEEISRIVDAGGQLMQGARHQIQETAGSMMSEAREIEADLQFERAQ